VDADASVVLQNSPAIPGLARHVVHRRLGLGSGDVPADG
jgi:hypothetical protein